MSIRYTKRPAEIMLETYRYYTSDPNNRAYNKEESRCQYLTKDGRMCAVGRCLSYPAYITSAFGVSMDAVYDEAISLMKPEYIFRSQEFWADLQSWHDNSSYWKDNVLTTEGEIGFQTLYKRWSSY